MYQIKKCPYCDSDNHIDIREWARIKCEECGGVYMAEIVSDIQITKFPNKGEDVEPTDHD